MKEKQPIYANKTLCPKCKSEDTFPIFNTYGSELMCHSCKYYTFPQKIIGYKEVIVEKERKP